MSWRPLYHVPRSQVWEGSRGRQSGAVHLHLSGEYWRSGRLYRRNGQSLCGRSGWYEREPTGDEPRCGECVRRAARHGVEWPS